jgi:hypothetical protein
MAQNYGPKISTLDLILNIDPSNNKSYPAFDLPVKDGLVMWMDAADDSTFSYSSGTTVSQWRDKSGFNYHMTPVTAGPTRNAFLNSRKVLAFTTSQNIVSLSFTMETSANTVFVVSRLTGTTNSRVLTAYYNNWLLGHWGAQFNKYYAEGWVYGATDPADTVWRMYMGDWSGSSTDLASFYSNGTALASGSTAASAGPKGLGINISGTEQSTCEVAEIIVFNRLLSTKERNLIHTYLGQKWGISNTDRQIFDLSGNNFNFAFNGSNPRYNAKSIVSNFDTASPFAVSSFGGQNLTSNILNLLYSDHTIEVAFNAKGFRSVYSYNNTLTTQDGQSIVIWTGRHSGLRVAQNQILYEYWNSQSTVVGIGVSISSYIDKIIYITATRTGDVLRLYINGVLASGPSTMAATTSPVSYSQINIGAAYQGNPTTQGYVWAAQHEYHLLRMYNRQLTDTEVASNYQAFKARFDNNIVRFGLVLDLDAGNPLSYAGAGSTWYDVSGNSFNATLINSPTYSSDNGGVLNWASASSQYATVSMNSTLRVANISEEVWVYLSGTADQIFIGSQYGTSSNNSFALWIQSGTFYFGVNTGGTFYYTTSSAPSTGTWYHLVHTYNGTTQYLYINGVLTTTFNSSASGNISYDTNNTLLAIGADFNGSGYNVGPTGYVNGKMPVARIYNIALSAAQVLQNYNATKGRFGL